MSLIFFALIFEHLLCQSTDLAKINIAFFQMNALVGLILIMGVAATIYVPQPWYGYLGQNRMFSTITTQLSFEPMR